MERQLFRRYERGISMIDHNAFMDFVWRLNAVDNGLYEPEQLMSGLIAQHGELTRLTAATLIDASMRAFWTAELKRSIDNLAELEQIVGALLNNLREYALSCAGGKQSEQG
jgi:hypothetical protein